jgi:DNA-binding NarL/FixJ family response regulator
MPKFKGDEVISRIMVHKPYAKIVVLSNYDEGGFVRSCINNGAKGYILKDIDPSDLIEAIETVYSGGVYYSGQVSEKLQAVVEAPEKIDLGLSKKLGLSRRELEILRFIAGEYTNEQIGKQLGISKRTVDTHRQNLLHKTHAKNTAGLIRFAITNAVV